MLALIIIIVFIIGVSAVLNKSPESQTNSLDQQTQQQPLQGNGLTQESFGTNTPQQQQPLQSNGLTQQGLSGPLPQQGLSGPLPQQESFDDTLNQQQQQQGLVPSNIQNSSATQVSNEPKIEVPVTAQQALQSDALAQREFGINMNQRTQQQVLQSDGLAQQGLLSPSSPQQESNNALTVIPQEETDTNVVQSNALEKQDSLRKNSSSPQQVNLPPVPSNKPVIRLGVPMLVNDIDDNIVRAQNPFVSFKRKIKANFTLNNSVKCQIAYCVFNLDSAKKFAMRYHPDRALKQVKDKLLLLDEALMKKVETEEDVAIMDSYNRMIEKSKELYTDLSKELSKSVTSGKCKTVRVDENICQYVTAVIENQNDVLESKQKQYVEDIYRMKLEFDTNQASNIQEFVSQNKQRGGSGSAPQGESLLISVIDDVYKKNEDMIGGQVKSMLPTLLFMYTIKTARLLYYEKYETLENKCDYYHTMLFEQLFTVLILMGLTIVDNMELFYMFLLDSVVSTLILMFKKEYREYTLMPFFMIY